MDAVQAANSGHPGMPMGMADAAVVLWSQFLDHDPTTPTSPHAHRGLHVDSHQHCVNTIKGLAMDAVQAANSGHPGMPMGMADAAVVLWSQFLDHDPTTPTWPDRDRFVLSAGHGSMLLYSLLHLAGYDVTLDDIKAFRQLGSRTPGHPEYGHTAGVETTTGPLGQGFATGVGMAIAERFLRETFGEDLVDHWTYGIVSDGDLMEGISYEAASIAGHLGLGRIVYLYDDNAISIDGSTDLSFTEDRAARFEAQGWHTVIVDGHDAAAIATALAAARAETARPSLICCRTLIGKDSPLEGSEKSHGAPLGAERIIATKERLGMDPSEHFAILEGAREHLSRRQGAESRAAWQARVDAHPRGAELMSWLSGDAESILGRVEWPSFESGGKLATRKASAAVLAALVDAAPSILGGSADLAGSNGVKLAASPLTRETFAGAGTVHFGVREHAMAAISNGMALHGGLIPYCATFLVFHDYMRPAVRLSCLMQQRVVYVYTHDSIFLGEDGPTHQPIETLLALRSIPGMRVIRPADANETKGAWEEALRNTTGPTAIILTRQGLPILECSRPDLIARGAYAMTQEDQPDVVLIATGSEVATVLAARESLAAEGIRARVVSMPDREQFLGQDADYRASVLPVGVPRLAVEAGTTIGWHRVVGDHGAVQGIDTFGASAPIADLERHFGFTPAAICERVHALLGR